MATTTTRIQLRQEVDTLLRLVSNTPYISRTATGGSTSTVVDTSAVEADDYWKGYFLYVTDTHDDLVPKGEERTVTDFNSVTDTYTITPAFSAAVASTDTYELRRFFSASQIHSAIDQAIEQYEYIYPNISEDETTVILEHNNDYTLPSSVDFIQYVDLLDHTVLWSGTATSGAATTITDTGKSWTVNALAGEEVAVYDGTGAGQYRTVASNTATAITVTVAWATNPASGSKYYVKDASEPPYVSKVTMYEHAGSKIHLPDNTSYGQRLRITYIPVHTTMTTDASTTTLPKTLIVKRALVTLLGLAPSEMPSSIASSTLALRDRLETEIQYFINNHRASMTHGRILNRGSGSKWSWKNPGSSSSAWDGTRKHL